MTAIKLPAIAAGLYLMAKLVGWIESVWRDIVQTIEGALL